MTSLSLPGPLHQPGHGAEALLRPHAAPRHLSALLRRQLQRHPQEIPQHGGQSVWLPLDRRRATQPSGTGLLFAAEETLEMDNNAYDKPTYAESSSEWGEGALSRLHFHLLELPLKSSSPRQAEQTHTFCAFYCIYKTLKAVTFVPLLAIVIVYPLTVEFSVCLCVKYCVNIFFPNKTRHVFITWLWFLLYAAPPVLSHANLRAATGWSGELT